MTRGEQPVLRLKVSGPRVRRGRIAVPDLIRICQEAQSAVNKQAEALEGKKTLHPGPVSGVILQECTLELIAVKKGSTTLEFAFAQPQTRIPEVEAIGTKAISQLVLSIKSLANGNKRNIDPGVLQSVYNLGGIAGNRGITGIQWIVPGRGKHGKLEAPLNSIVRQRAAQRLSAPRFAAAHADGVLDMADFKPEDRKCRIDQPTGAPILCTFESDLDDTVQGLLRKTVRGIGTARYAAYAQKIEILHLKELLLLPSLSLGQFNFQLAPEITELAEMQKVKPLCDPSLLAGAIPADQDVDEFLDEIYSTRK